jgi:hypothetical protein
MGIRFFCPNGHKLNVKAFQAGRRGICPHCGVSVEIPLQSTRPTSKERGAPTGGRPSAGGDIPPPLPSATANSGEMTKVPPLLPREAVNLAMPVSRRPDPIPGTSDAGDFAQPSAVPSVPPIGDPPSFVKDVSGPGAALPLPDVPDPLADGPEVVWYLRPPSGGQYGPATQEVMRTWLREGRVTPDSLVWREGWRDWEDAADVFPESAFPESRIPDAVPGLDSLVGVPFAGPIGRGPQGMAGTRSVLNQALIILALVALGAAVLGLVYLLARYPSFWARFS